MQEYNLVQNVDGVEIPFYAKMANRHGIITGATGTGKTITLRKLAETFSDDNIPVFIVDVKGDLSGIAKQGTFTGKVAERMQQLGLAEDGYFKAYPTVFWDILGKNGIPLRTTISEMGPMLLSRLLSLNDVQSSLLLLVFKVADEHKLPLIDLKDLRALLQYVANNAKEYQLKYGNISAASIAAILRQLLQLEEQGSEVLFGEPALNIADLIQTDGNNGVINILDAQTIIDKPNIFSAFLLWLLSDLFETLPEVGDLDKPKFVLFFDEAHLLFHNAQSALVEKIAQVVRLIRSKGVGVYFATQNPLDIPDIVLAQLGNVFQHSLRAFTPKEQKNIKAVADMFRVNPKLDVRTEISTLGVGEALVSFLDEKGAPQQVEKVYVYPPSSQLAPLTETEKNSLIKGSSVYDFYSAYIDNISAYEILQQQLAEQTATNTEANQDHAEDALGKWGKIIFGSSTAKDKKSRSMAENLVDNVSKSVGRKLTNTVANKIVRGLLGSIMKIK